MGQRVRRYCGFLIPLFALLGLVAILQPARMRAVLADFSPRSVAIVLVVFLVRELIKSVRWWYFLHAAGVSLTFGDGSANFLAGQAVGVLPLGEVLRARLLREHGVPAYEVIPVVLMQFACDLMVYALIALVAASRGIIVWWLAIVPLLLPMVLAAVFSSDRLAARLTATLQRHRRTARFVPMENDLRARMARLFRPRPLLCGIGLTFISTAASGIVLVTLVGDLTRQTLNVSDALVANALSTLAGTISLIPGGWGVTDGSLSGLLTLFGVGAGVAFSVALVFRFLDLLFRTVLGIVVLFARYRSLFFAPPTEDKKPQLQPVPVKPLIVPD